jgi:hypothetical protein
MLYYNFFISNGKTKSTRNKHRQYLKWLIILWMHPIHHAPSYAPSIWQDGSGIPNDSNVVIVPLQLRSYGTYYWTRLWILVSNSNQRIMHTHGHNIQYTQFLQYHTVRCHPWFNNLYWISICEVEGKGTISSAKHWFQDSNQEIHCHKLGSNTLWYIRRGSPEATSTSRHQHLPTSRHQHLQNKNVWSGRNQHSIKEFNFNLVFLVV